MTQRLQIGRVGLDVQLDDPEDYASSATREGSRGVTLRGALSASSLAETLELRDQLQAQAELGLVVPVTWDGDARLDGYYEIESVSVDTRWLTDAGWVEFEVQLLWFGGTLEGTTFEVDVNFALRENTLGITDPLDVYTSLTLPTFDESAQKVYYVDDGAETAFPDRHLRLVVRDLGSAASSEVLEVGSSLSNGHTPNEGSRIRLGVDIERFYLGAATIQVDERVLAGRRVPPGAVPGWRLSNGLISIEPAAAPNLGRLVLLRVGQAGSPVEGEWSTQSTEFVLSYNVFVSDSPTSSGVWYEFTPFGVEVLENRPEYAAVRLTGNQTSLPFSYQHLDLGLRRGSRFVDAQFTLLYKDTLTEWERGLKVSTGEMASSINGDRGLEALVTDSDGNRWMLTHCDTSSTLVTDAGSGTIYFLRPGTDYEHRFPFGFGAGWGAGPPGRNEDQVRRYLVATDEQWRGAMA